MIVKLTKRDGISRLIESSDVMCQPVIGGRVDIEVTVRGASSLRFLIGEDGPAVDVITAETIWDRAYIMEGGKTVDTIRGHYEPSKPEEVALSSVESERDRQRRSLRARPE